MGQAFINVSNDLLKLNVINLSVWLKNSTFLMAVLTLLDFEFS